MAGLYTGDEKSGQVWVRTPGKPRPSVYNDLRGTMSGGLESGTVFRNRNSTGLQSGQRHWLGRWRQTEWVPWRVGAFIFRRC